MTPILRFNLLTLSLVMLGACATSSLRNEDPLRPKGLVGFSILQGMTDTESTELSVLAEKSDHLTYQLIDEKTGRKITPSRIERAQRGYSNWCFDQVLFDNLLPDQVYRFTITNSDGVFLDTRFLKTFPILKTHPKVAVASCLDDSFVSEQLEQWRDLATLKPDLLLLIGDNFYADRFVGPYKGPVDEKTHWSRAVETRNLLEWYRMDRLTPTIAVWDDHDFGQNDGDRTFEEVKQVTENFRASIAQSLSQSPWLERGPGVGVRLTFFNHTFHLMDGRSFRTPDHSPSAMQTPWGEEQEKWLFESLNHPKTSRDAQFLINGTQFFGGYIPARESYQLDHPESFKKLLTKLSESRIPVVFISGDAHSSELMQIPKRFLGYSTYELTTSGIHARIIPRDWKKNPNPLQIAGNDTEMNYALLAFTGRNQLTATVYGRKKAILFSKSLVLPEQK